jgi:hypothetical protein
VSFILTLLQSRVATEHIWFKSVFDLEIMDFENVALTKIVHIHVIEGMNA